MYRFFVSEDQIGETKIIIEGSDVNHIKNVLRMKPGDELLISAGDSREYHCAIADFAEGQAVVEIRYIQETGLELPTRIYLFQGLPKGDKMDLIVQKAVELGVREIIPVAMKRSVVKLDSKKAEHRIARWNKISESAAKQAGRMVIPGIGSVMSFAEALDYADETCDICLMPYELEEGMLRTRQLLEAIRPSGSLGVFIGPEGGFSPEEVSLARERGVHTLTLGKRILRTETAGMTMLSILMYLLEE